jgi:hypothetical protein
MTFSEGQSFRISKQIGSGRALPSCHPKTCPITYRVKLLGRALLAVRTDMNSFWMLLLGNAEIPYTSRATRIAVAAYLPTPATAAALATSPTHVVAIATSVIPALTTAATGSLRTAAAAVATNSNTPPTPFASDHTVTAAAADVATPSAGQKRKAQA